jgi:ABC-type antimicrobial peptide transport system permease subunit
MLRERYRIHTGDSDDLYIRDMAEITKAPFSTAALMAKLLLVVVLVSFIVGAVEIMNTVLVSVAE